MTAVKLHWDDDDDEPSHAFPPFTARRAAPATGELAPGIASAVWRAAELGSQATTVLGSGFVELDAELPGGGWPCHALSELLQPQASVAEWRLLAPAMRQVVAKGLDVVVVAPPKHPHLPGLIRVGLDEQRLIWIQADSPAERLWATEQLVKANAAGLLVAWLPQARPEQIRRLQICAHACDGPVVVCRPLAAENEASAAPLRIGVRFGFDWELHLRILKRRGPTHEGVLRLPSIPGGLEDILTPRLRAPSELLRARRARDAAATQAPHALGRPASERPCLQRVGAH